MGQSPRATVAKLHYVRPMRARHNSSVVSVVSEDAGAVTTDPRQRY
jgi:hypothetical protein